MSWFTAVLVYVIIWWVVIFAVLPWGASPPDRPEPGHAPSAPEKPMLWQKALITTVISAVIWAIVFYVIESGVISFRQ
jgi:predicted secreted protein